MTTAPSKYWALLAAVALLQIGFLAKMAFHRVSLIKNGREIALQVMPVDPRDVFRGEYVILGYDISQVRTPPEADAGRDDRYARGQTVFVTLHRVQVSSSRRRGHVTSTDIDRSIVYFDKTLPL